ncbi:MAG: peptidoglycan D,D-transpeptidase FtsI family protein [Candidatus Limnocylindrales bacterium]
MLGRTDSRVRALVILLVFVVVAGALGTRLAYWQIARRNDLAAMAVRQSSTTYSIPTQRGSIYDRTGTVLLATSVNRDRLAVDSKDQTPDERAQTAATAVQILGLSGDAATTVTALVNSGRPYAVLAHDLTPAQSDAVRSAVGAAHPTAFDLILEPEELRQYPQAGGAPGTTLAAQLLGFVNQQGLGQYGVEQYYQTQLAGKDTVVAAQQDGSGNLIPDTSTVMEQGYPGEDLELTIDASLQVAVEQELLATWIADRAKRVSAVVMDPYSGEIYAYASYPSYNANDYQQIANTNPGVFLDPNVSTVYEPGSVFKMLTATAVIGTGAVQPTTKFNDPGRLWLDNHLTHVDDADKKPMPRMTFANGVAFSRNVVASQAALRLAPTTNQAAKILYSTWLRLGFGQKTGIDVANEVSGILHDPSQTPWRQIDLANASFGQGMAVTPIQLAQGFSAMLNGGTLVQPRVVKSIGNQDTAAVSKGRVMTPQLSQTLMKMMKGVISTVPFYRNRTLIPGFEVGGKTGTAQIWDTTKNDWKKDLFNYSFIGYIARNPGHPDLVVAVRIDQGTPKVIRQGQLEMPVMSFELFRRIAHDSITTPYLVPETQVVPPPPAAAP